ncbi:phage GP46 family protein [Pararoseomonas indoligenes]|uniref:Phage GP46 family protein n=1 Tax=Roseomonas indoligenes TaxID=2820811 RepID=A0A940MUE0_9PROT|nr:phage GP46 family protein [Pararoseomonas indoligenes]MBP0492156.1 phage GP46 family protein [Pararoseomonas indoligenes]
MSADVAITFDSETGRGDWQITGMGNLLLAPPMVTAVYVSLFTDRRAGPDDVLEPGETDRRGWWGEGLDNKPIGSRLWLLRRAKHLPETLKRARDYIREALAWMIEDELAAKVDVVAEWQTRSRIAAVITIHRVNGTQETVTASWAWQGV